MSSRHYLVDTSAVVRIAREPEVKHFWREQIGAGLIAISPITELELLYSARSKSDRDEIQGDLRIVYVEAIIPDRIYERALDVQESLTRRGAHRSAGAVDLLTAAISEEHGMTLLHYDADYLQIAEVTGQPVKWVADPGSVP